MAEPVVSLELNPGCFSKKLAEWGEEKTAHTCGEKVDRCGRREGLAFEEILADCARVGRVQLVVRLTPSVVNGNKARKSGPDSAHSWCVEVIAQTINCPCGWTNFIVKFRCTSSSPQQTDLYLYRRKS
jgi:hypothetical protein